MNESNNTIIQLIKEIHIPLIVILLYIFKYISLINIAIVYISICLYERLVSRLEIIFSNKNKLMEKIYNNLKTQKYIPKFLIPFHILQFIFLNSSLVKPKYKISVEREYIGDNGIAIDWLNVENKQNKDNKKILMIFPGLTGGIKDAYVMNMADKGILNEYKVGIYQMRILTEKFKIPIEPNKYMNLFEDVSYTLKHIKNKYGSDCKIFAIGFSYGANQIVRYLGEFNCHEHLVEAAVSISAPYTFPTCDANMRYTIYGKMLLKFLLEAFTIIDKPLTSLLSNSKYEDKYKINVNLIRNTKNITDFDTNFTSKILGYQSASEYYREIGSSHFVKYIDIPLLIVHSKDDPITTSKNLPLDDFRLNENIMCILTNRGAHSCFLESNGLFKVKQWNTDFAIKFLNFIYEENN